MARKKEKAQSQRDRFEEAARALECDDNKDRFEKRLGKIAKAKPSKKFSARAK